MSMGSWLRTRRKQIITHTLIVGGFLFFLLFLSEPLFVRFEPRDIDRSTLQEISLPPETGNICYYFNRVGSDANKIDIIGYAFIGGVNTKNNRIFVCLKSCSYSYVFDTFIVPRPDVTENFAYLDLNLDLAGYKAMIPLEKIENGTYKVGIYIKKGRMEALQYTDMVVIKSEHGVELPLWTATLQEISLPAKSQPMKFHIDRLEQVVKVVKEEKEYVEIEGWAFIEGESPEQSQTYVVLSSGTNLTNLYVFDTWPKYTPWVTRRYQDSGLDLDWVGFTTRIPKEQLEDGTYQLGIYVKRGGIEASQYTDDIGNRHSLTIPFPR